VRGKATANINLDLGSELMAGVVFKALLPETRSSPVPRSKVAVQVEGRRLNLMVEAADSSALRASLNSYGRWILCLMRLFNVVE